jgi:hypothetical protein
MERFFVLVNRLNSLLLLLVLLGAAAAIAWMSAESSHWRRRGTVEVAASEPATGDSVLMAFERAEVITGSQTLMLRLTGSRKSAGFSSGGGGSETRNVLFLAGADRAPRWLFADHRHVVLTLAQLREDAAPEDRATRWLYVEHVSQDSNQGGRLSDDDLSSIAMVRADGSGMTEVLRDVQRVLTYNMPDAQHLSIVYQQRGAVRHAKVSLDPIKIDSDQEIVKVPAP